MHRWNMIGLIEIVRRKFPVGVDFQRHPYDARVILKIAIAEQFGNRMQIVEQGFRLRVKAPKDEATPCVATHFFQRKLSAWIAL